jgi:hypothetical protein
LSFSSAMSIYLTNFSTSRIYASTELPESDFSSCRYRLKPLDVRRPRHTTILLLYFSLKYSLIFTMFSVFVSILNTNYSILIHEKDHHHKRPKSQSPRQARA